LVLVAYSMFVFDSIASETSRYGNPLDHLRQMLEQAP
jgi:hypothetical protein